MKRFPSVLLAAALFAGTAHAQGIDADAKAGAELYKLHCASCHGLDAKGAGPMAPVLLIQPSDLTTLTQRHDGRFPVARVVMRIDGRDPLVSHGSPMPVYGYFFDGTETILKSEAGQPVLTSVPVADLLAYLQNLQE